MPYSLNAFGVGLPMTQMLFGNYVAGKAWGLYTYRHTVPSTLNTRPAVSTSTKGSSQVCPANATRPWRTSARQPLRVPNP